MMQKWMFGRMILAAVLLPFHAEAQSKAADYLKNGKLKERVEVILTQSGFAGATGNYYTINPDGTWATGSVWIPKEDKSKPKQTGKLTAKQLTQLAQSFARYDLRHLSNFGEPVVNPKTLSIQLGAKTFTMIELRPTPEKPLSADDKAITARYQGILQAVQSICKSVSSHIDTKQIEAKK